MKKRDIDYNLVGKRIKECRLNKNMTQDDMANSIEVNPSFISNIERGKAKMSTETLANISTCLNTSIDYLLFGNIILEHDQHTNEAILEIQRILKDGDKNYVNNFTVLCKEIAKFLQKICK